MFSPVFYLSVENIAYNRLADSTYAETVVRVDAVDVISDSWRRISFLFFLFFLSGIYLFPCILGSPLSHCCLSP